MQFLFDKKHKDSLFEQAFLQLVTALHMGKVGAGDRLPSVRQMALRNNINHKTAFSIYQRLHLEGYITLRRGSGAYVSDIDHADLEQAYSGAGSDAGATFTGVASVRPDLIGNPQILGTPNQWFTNTVCDPRAPAGCPSGAVFALPVTLSGTTNVYHFGSLGRNVLIGPGFKNVDFSVTKNTKLTESVRFQFRAEFFDIFNHANFGQPGRTAQVGSTAFGLISGTRFPTGDSGSSRQVQFAAKFLF